MPVVRDMARIQFGNSRCQISGTYVPVADMNLATGEGVYFAHHVLLWREPQVVMGAMPMKGGFKRLLAGLPIVMTQAQGPGHIAFSRDVPGEMLALPIQPGQAVDVREHMLVVASHQVSYDFFNSNIWFRTATGNDTETHYPVGMFMDRFYAQQSPGLVLIHAGGNAFIRQLAPGQSILIKPPSLLFKDASVQMQLHVEHPAGAYQSWRSWGNRYLWLRLFGPGRVAIQSSYERLEDSGNNLVGTSGATTRQW